MTPILPTYLQAVEARVVEAMAVSAHYGKDAGVFIPRQCDVDLHKLVAMVRVAVEALEWESQETGTPYGRVASEALAKLEAIANG